jgi:uracil-DNA glycosylase
MERLPEDRLTLLVGSYAQEHYLPDTGKIAMTERVRAFQSCAPQFLPLPHPSWRSTGWMKRNPWFEGDVLPILRDKVSQVLSAT